jgi:RTX calcium-binding nonapeptide repeat (4 copies)/NHL repeat
VAVTADGGFLIADTDNELVRRVSPAGTITTVAGTSPGGFAGDGGPATAALLNEPTGVAPTTDGGFLIADSNNQRVRRVSPAGTITTVAGNGTAGFSGDGGPAVAAQLFGPSGVAVTADGGFLIADSLNNRVRRVSLAGTITTVAGNGTEGSSGDTGPANAAQLHEPQAVAQTADGGFLIADLRSNRIRFVDADLGIPQPPPPSETTCLGRPVTIVAVAGAGLTRGTPGNDVIVGSKAADRIASGGGRDRVCSRGGDDRVSTGAGGDRVSAGPGDDRVSTGGGADRINPGSGGDRVSSGSGDDRIGLAGSVRDVLDCGAGRDRVLRDRDDRLRACERIRRG